MKKEIATSGTNGIGIGSVLFLIFLVLKLTGYIGWSWWWVTCPLWALFAIIGVFLVLVLFAGLITLAIVAWKG